METAVNDLVTLLLKNLNAEYAEQVSISTHFECSTPTKKGHRCTTCLNCLFFELLNRFSQKTIDAVISCKHDKLILFKTSYNLTINYKFLKLGLLSILETLRARTQIETGIHSSTLPNNGQQEGIKAFFALELCLEIPNIVCRPALIDLQNGFGKAINFILRISDGIQPWEHVKYCQALFKVNSILYVIFHTCYCTKIYWLF